MTKPAKPPADVATAQAVGKSVTTSPEPWPPQGKVKKLAAMLDGMGPEAEAMLNLHERLWMATNDSARRRILREAEKVIEHFEKTGGKACFKSGRLQKLSNECAPESWWAKGGGPAYSQVAKMVTILLGSFPTSKIPEPDIFVRVLLDDVMELKPSFVEMESTCRKLRTKKPFMPSISEVMAELEEQQELWGRRFGTREVIEDFFDELCAEVTKAKAEDKQAHMIEPRQELPMAPIEAPHAVKDEEKF